MNDCTRMIEEFEVKWAREVIGARIVDGNLFYQLLFKSKDTREISAIEAREKWPELLTTFLEKRMIWGSQAEPNLGIDIDRTANLDGNAVAIICRLLCYIIYYCTYKLAVCTIFKKYLPIMTFQTLPVFDQTSIIC